MPYWVNPAIHLAQYSVSMDDSRRYYVEKVCEPSHYLQFIAFTPQHPQPDVSENICSLWCLFIDLLSIATFNLIYLHNLLRQPQLCQVRQFSHPHSQRFSTNTSLAPFPNKKLRLFLERRPVKIISSILSTLFEHWHEAAKHTSCL